MKVYGCPFACFINLFAKLLLFGHQSDVKFRISGHSPPQVLLFAYSFNNLKTQNSATVNSWLYIKLFSFNFQTNAVQICRHVAACEVALLGNVCCNTVQ
jgi:hypothetical protein